MVAARNHMMYTLPVDLNSALNSSEATIVRLQERFPIEMSMSAIVKVDGSPKVYRTRVLIIHSLDSFNRSLLETDFEDNVFADTSFDPRTGLATSIKWEKVFLEICDHVRGKKTCHICRKTVLSASFACHFRKCSNGKGCSICQCVVPGDLKTHKESCGVRKFACRLCEREFPTGGSRAAHEKLCRRAETEVVEPQSKRQRIVQSKYHQKSAIKGRFRVITLPVGYKTDHEGAFVELRDQIRMVLDESRASGIKAYLVAEMRMKQLLDDTKTSNAYFPSSHATFLTSTDIKEVVEEQIAGNFSYTCTSLDLYILYTKSRTVSHGCNFIRLIE